MRRALIALTAALGLVLVGCSADQEDPAQQLLAPHGLDGMQTTDLIDHMDRLGGPDRPSDLLASVRADTLLISDGTTEQELPIEGEEFYLSFAPYLNQTHDCFYHSLTTCQAELPNTAMDVMITGADGEVYVDEEMTTFDNGFMGVWLPKDVEATLEVSVDGLSATQDISTDVQAPTCLTTIRLG
ncbi:CueP family metal-binding protein [Pseudactinotalea sp. Z1732]|uniref:CueP family metal-binding protein n=1 Tax=Micrococcales TaxID=85006 RepID=UPI003C7E40F9